MALLLDGHIDGWREAFDHVLAQEKQDHCNGRARQAVKVYWRLDVR